MRPVLNAFANYMEKILHHHDHKNGWENVLYSYLLARLKDEVNELEDALLNREDIEQECADVANYAMMIFDNRQCEVRKQKQVRKQKHNTLTGSGAPTGCANMIEECHNHGHVCVLSPST